MNLYSYEAAFGASDVTSRAMKTALEDWFSLYYNSDGDQNSDPCQRIAYTVVEKLVPAKKAALVELNKKALALGKEYK